MKRIFLFVLTNLAVVVVLGIVASLLGVNRFLTANGLNLGQLLVFAAIMGFGGAIISLLLSKTIAKWSSGVQVIDQPRNADEAWIVDTVRRFANEAKIGMPEVGIFEGEPNAFATGAFKNNALVAVSTGLLQGMTRERNTTKVFITPWISVMVTMSPLAMCATSWPITASTSSRVMPCSRPVETATSALFLKAPVANAFGSPWNTPTSGMPMPALSAKRRTVSTIQRWSGPSSPVMTCTPDVHLAIGLEISSEMIAPPKPMTKANPSSMPRLRPLAVR